VAWEEEGNEDEMRALVTRWGAIGDHIVATPVFRLLKKEGYEVTYHTNAKGVDITKHNPFIDNYIIHQDRKLTGAEIHSIWWELENKYDRFINLTHSIEVDLLPTHNEKLFHASKEERHEQCNKNYYDYTLEKAGFNVTGRNGEIYIGDDEDRIARKFMRQFRGKFTILWALSGSSPHKAYPWSEITVQELRKRYRDLAFITVGDDVSRCIEWEGKDTVNTAGEWSIRRSIIMPKYVDLVIGPETGVMNAAGCFDTPKILLLSHSTEENISKHWKNCVSLHAPEEIKCWPCHRLIHDTVDCPQTNILKRPACITNIKPTLILRAIEQFRLRRAA
jgi:ADP-heptose:LPS heptosyltransferase